MVASDAAASTSAFTSATNLASSSITPRHNLQSSGNGDPDVGIEHDSDEAKKKRKKPSALESIRLVRKIRVE